MTLTCLINHTGVLSTFSPRNARTNISESLLCSNWNLDFASVISCSNNHLRQKKANLPMTLDAEWRARVLNNIFTGEWVIYEFIGRSKTIQRDTSIIIYHRQKKFALKKLTSMLQIKIHQFQLFRSCTALGQSTKIVFYFVCRHPTSLD